MKTWTNPEMEELEVAKTAGGRPWTLTEWGYPGIFDIPTNDGDGEGDDEPGKDQTTDGLS